MIWQCFKSLTNGKKEIKKKNKPLASQDFFTLTERLLFIKILVDIKSWMAFFLSFYNRYNLMIKSVTLLNELLHEKFILKMHRKSTVRKRLIIHDPERRFCNSYHLNGAQIPRKDGNLLHFHGSAYCNKKLTKWNIKMRKFMEIGGKIWSVSPPFIPQFFVVVKKGKREREKLLKIFSLVFHCLVVVLKFISNICITRKRT